MTNVLPDRAQMRTRKKTGSLPNFWKTILDKILLEHWWKKNALPSRIGAFIEV